MKRIIMKIKYHICEFKCQNKDCNHTYSASYFGQVEEIFKVLQNYSTAPPCILCNKNTVKLTRFVADYEDKVKLKNMEVPKRWYFEFKCQVCNHSWDVVKYLTEKEAHEYLIYPWKTGTRCPMCLSEDVLTITGSNYKR